MNFEEYKIFRDSHLGSQPLRLDCMNIYQSMAFLAPPPVPTAKHFTASEITGLLAQSLRFTGNPAELLTTTGVRPCLMAIFQILAGQGYTLWLSQDVYPIYQEYAHEIGARIQTFATFPAIDWSFLARTTSKSALLLANPLMPAGRRLAIQEMSALASWVKQGERRLIFDTVYSFTSYFDPLYRIVMETGRCFLAYSVAKAFLLPDTLGLLHAPRQYRRTLAHLLPPPTAEALGKLDGRLAEQPALPSLLAQNFRAEWQRLTPLIRHFYPGWQPPECGYFAVIPVPATELLNRHNVMAVPASVFGSLRKDYAIVSCLYYMGQLLPLYGQRQPLPTMPTKTRYLPGATG